MHARYILSSITLAASLLAIVPIAAQQPSLDGIQAGIDAFQQAEGQRQAAVSRQIIQNDALRYRPAWNSPYGNVTYYHRGYAGDMPASYYSSYSYRRGPFGGEQFQFGGNSGYLNQPAYGYSPYGYGYGSILGPTSLPPTIRQAIGRREVQTGPNRWESFPIYAEDETPVYRPEVKPKTTGPREF